MTPRLMVFAAAERRVIDKASLAIGADNLTVKGASAKPTQPSRGASLFHQHDDHPAPVLLSIVQLCLRTAHISNFGNLRRANTYQGVHVSDVICVEYDRGSRKDDATGLCHRRAEVLWPQ